MKIERRGGGGGTFEYVGDEKTNKEIFDCKKEERQFNRERIFLLVIMAPNLAYRAPLVRRLVNECKRGRAKPAGSGHW